MLCCLVLCFCVFAKSGAFDLESFSIEDTVEIFVPTLASVNQKCRNDSVFYVEELKKLKLWATEMFDSSSKLPSGVLFGSAFDFGNFDECVGVKVALEGEELVGKYCMVKFHVAPPDFQGGGQKYRFYDNEDHFTNVSTWEKVVTFANDRSRNNRNDFYLSFCIPSSCHHTDLASSLREITERINAFSNFKVTATVDHLNCQVREGWNLRTSDLIFISVFLIFSLIAAVATAYDCLFKLDDLQKLRVEGKIHDLLIAFSVQSNLKKLNTEQENDGGLQCIHGLKVISMFLVIMGHRIMFSIGSPLVNPNFVEHLYGQIEASVLLNGPIIVDTFFNISGFLVCYLMLLEYEKHNKRINFVFLYIHRFIRLTPAYAVVLAFYCTMFIKLGSGPFWLERVQVEQERCITSWWANLFYLNNYFNKDKICMFQSWYMTCDMHFFLAAPVIVWLLRKKSHLGVGALLVIIIASISVVFAIVYLSQEDAILLLYMKFLKDPVVNNTFKNVYIPTHMRASPYFVGMATGYLKYQMRSKQYKMPKYVVYIGWIICVFVIEVTVYAAFIFYLPGKPYDGVVSAVYASMHHFTWSICISWMILAISEGNGAWVEPLLKWKPLVLLSRITYPAFLCHGAIQIYSVATLRQAVYASLFNLISFTASDIVLSYTCGLVLSMLFEAPIIGIEKILLRKRVKSKREDKVKGSATVVPKIKIISQFD